MKGREGIGIDYTKKKKKGSPFILCTQKKQSFYLTSMGNLRCRSLFLLNYNFILYMLSKYILY